MSPRVPRRPDPEPLELDDTRVVAAGTMVWLMGLVALLLGDLVGLSVHGWWYAMCLCGVALGLVGLRYVARRKRAIARDAATAAGGAADPDSAGGTAP